MINKELKKLLVPVDDLHADARNAREHSSRNVRAIRRSLDEFGQQKPIVALNDGTVIAGNGTLAAALELGWAEIAVVRFDDEKRARAFAIADNRTAELAKWDRDRLIEELSELDDPDVAGFTRDELDKLYGDTADEIDLVEVDPSEVNFVCRITGPLPSQPEVLTHLKKAMEQIDGVEIEITTNVV